jgi:hypothetical protein
MVTVHVFHDRRGVAHFTCEDCGADVHNFGPVPAAPCCAGCLFIREADVTDEERENLRKILGCERAS